MSIFNKIEDQFDGEKKELSNKFKKLSTETIKSFDELNDEMNDKKIINATVMLTACQDSDDEDDISLSGGIMGKTRDIIGLLGQAMMRDGAFKNVVKKAIKYADNNGIAVDNDSDEPSIHAMALGPNGEKLDLSELPDEVKDGLKKMLEKDLGISRSSSIKSRGSDLIDKFLDSNDSNNFNDDIDELNNEDF